MGLVTSPSSFWAGREWVLGWQNCPPLEDFLQGRKKNTRLTLGLELRQTQVSGREQGTRQQGWSWTETEGHACWKNLKLRRTVSSGSQDGSYNSSRKTLELLGQVHLANIITSERFPFCYLSCFLSFFLSFFFFFLRKVSVCPEPLFFGCAWAHLPIHK